jgi:hypothetical protein
MSVEKFGEAQHRIVEATYGQHRSYGYAAGYMQSLAKQMFQSMTKRQQAEFLRQVEQDAVRLETLAQLTA